MPTYVNPNKCDGCKALDRPACVYTCPSDIMWLNTDIGKAFNREPDLCWECYACVKTCPISSRSGSSSPRSSPCRVRW